MTKLWVYFLFIRFPYMISICTILFCFNICIIAGQLIRQLSFTLKVRQQAKQELIVLLDILASAAGQRRARWGLPGRVKKQDIQILIFGIEQESRKIFSNFPYQVKNQEFWQSKTPFKKNSRYFKIFFLVTSKKREPGFKILRKEISRIEIEFWQ